MRLYGKIWKEFLRLSLCLLMVGSASGFAYLLAPVHWDHEPLFIYPMIATQIAVSIWIGLFVASFPLLVVAVREENQPRRKPT